MRNVIIALVVIVVLGGGWWYLSMQTVAPTTSTSDTTQVTPTPDATATAGLVHEVTVTGSNFKFEPSTITVKKGETVKLTFVNSGGTHDWVIDQFNAKTNRIQSGASETIQFVADTAGSFEYYCSVGNHRAMGMKGTLVVSE